MMLAMHGRPSEVDPFLFTLAKDLGKTVAEMEATMTTLEYSEWQAWYMVQGAMAQARR